ncbi:MAG: Dps family protein [Cytophagaceae bacterium]|jgi:starvation-inducible DNA-binding protein
MATAKLNQIGIDNSKAQALAKKLNDLLANYHIFYQNLRGFHWNIRGNDFFTLHIKFEEIYRQSIEDIDEIAERIRTLGYIPMHAYSDYLKTSKIKEMKDVADARATVKDTLSNYTVILVKEREILDLAEEAGDEGTANMVSDFIQAQEKVVWMLSSWNSK